MKNVIKLHFLEEDRSSHDYNTGITTYFPPKFHPFEFEVNQQTYVPTFNSLMGKMGWDVFYGRTNPVEVEAAIKANTTVKTTYTLPSEICKLLTATSKSTCIIVSDSTWWEVAHNRRNLTKIISKGVVRPVKAAPFSRQLGVKLFKEAYPSPIPVPNFWEAVRAGNSRSLLLRDHRRRYLDFVRLYDSCGGGYFLQASSAIGRRVKKSRFWVANQRSSTPSYSVITDYSNGQWGRVNDYFTEFWSREKPVLQIADNSETNWVIQNAMAKLWEVRQRAEERMREVFGSEMVVDKKGKRTFSTNKWIASRNTFLLASDVTELENHGWYLERFYADRYDEGMQRDWRLFVEMGECNGVSVKGESVPRFTDVDLPRLRGYLSEGETIVGARFLLGMFDADGLWREMKIHISQVEKWPSEFKSMPKGQKSAVYWELPLVEIL